MNNSILSPNSDNLTAPNSSEAINRYNFLFVNPETRKTPPVSLNDLDCFPNSSNQEDTEALPSAVQLKSSKSQEPPSTTNTLQIPGSIESVVSTDNGDNYAKWKKLTLVAQSIQKFRSLKAEKIKSEGNLTKAIIETPCPKLESDFNKGVMHITAGDLQRSAINEFRYNASFFDALEIGGPEEIKYIRKALAHDPKANFYEVEDPQRLTNKPNHRGYSPLYIACKNANIELLKTLIEFKANPYQLCNITSKYRESILTVAARWGHMEILTYLLTNKFNWSEKELRRAFESTLNKDSQKLLKQKLTKFKKPFFGRLFACSAV